METLFTPYPKIHLKFDGFLLQTLMNVEKVNTNAGMTGCVRTKSADTTASAGLVSASTLRAIVSVSISNLHIRVTVFQHVN